MSARIDVRALYHSFADVARQRGMSPTAAGNALGVDGATMSRMRHGTIKDLHASRLLSMCRWAGLDPMDFLVEGVTNG